MRTGFIIPGFNCTITAMRTGALFIASRITRSSSPSLSPGCVPTDLQYTVDDGRSVLSAPGADQAEVAVWSSVSIIGQVGKPGAVTFPASGKLDLITSIAAAGSFTTLANLRRISINRGGKVTSADYRALSKQGADPSMLEPGDTITVPDRPF